MFHREIVAYEELPQHVGENVCPTRQVRQFYPKPTCLPKDSITRQTCSANKINILVLLWKLNGELAEDFLFLVGNSDYLYGVHNAFFLLWFL